MSSFPPHDQPPPQAQPPPIPLLPLSSLSGSFSQIPQGSLGKVLPSPVGLGRGGGGGGRWSPREHPPTIPVKMQEHPFCTHGSHLATPPDTQSPPTAHICEGDKASTGSSLSQATPWGVPPSFSPRGRSNQGELCPAAAASVGEGGAGDRSDAATSGAHRLGRTGRGSRDDPLARSFIQQAQSRPWVRRRQ